MTKKRKASNGSITIDDNENNNVDENIVFCWLTKKRLAGADERFCERIFNDIPTLITHQKAKHFACHLCPKKLNSAKGIFPM